MVIKLLYMCYNFGGDKYENSDPQDRMDPDP